MPTKSAATSRGRIVSRLRDAIKGFIATLSGQAVIDAGGGVVIIVALAMMLMHTEEGASIPTLAAGSVAPVDILAPEDIKVEDAVQTREMREHAAAAVL